MPSDEQIRAGLDRLASSLPTAATNADLTIAQDRGARRRRRRRVQRAGIAAIVLVAAAGLGAAAKFFPDENIILEPGPASAPDIVPTTTSLDPEDVREVTYYLLVAPQDQSQRKLAAYVRPIPSTDLLDSLIRPMFDPAFASGAGTEGLINVVTQFDFVTATRDDTSVATVELTVDEENLPGEQALRDAAAQLVWTLTQWSEVDAVQIMINGRLEPLPTDNGRETDPVTRGDYRFYDLDFAPEPVTTWTPPADDPTQPSPVAIAKDRELRTVPAGVVDCGSVVTTSGYPTTTAARGTQAECIVQAATEGTQAQYSITGRNFEGGMTGAVFVVAEDGTLMVNDYTVDKDGSADGTMRPCSSFVLEPNSPVPGCLD